MSEPFHHTSIHSLLAKRHAGWKLRMLNNCRAFKSTQESSHDYFTSILEYSGWFTNVTVIWIKMWVTTWRTSATSFRLEQGYSVTKTFDVITKSKLFPKTVFVFASSTKINANLENGKVFFVEHFSVVFVGPSRCVLYNNYISLIDSTLIRHRRLLQLLQHKIHFSYLSVHIIQRSDYDTQSNMKLQTRLLPFPLNYNHQQSFWVFFLVWWITELAFWYFYETCFNLKSFVC